MDKKMDIICEYIDLKRDRLFFNDNLYSTWESRLTKDELKIMKIYRFKNTNDYNKYIDLYSKLYTDYCDEMIKNKDGFKKKYENLMIIMWKSSLLTEDQKKNIKAINDTYAIMRINKGEHNERKKRRK